MTIEGATREPEEGFERMLLEGREGKHPIGAVLHAFGEAAIIVPSGADFNGAPEKFQPLMFTSQQGHPMMAVFTAMDRARLFSEKAPWVTTMSGRAVLTNLQPGVGIVVNPASDLGLEIAPPDVKRVLAELPALPEGPGPNLTVERAIRDARLGVLGHADVMRVLDNTSLFVATSQVDRIVPLVLDYNGQGYVAVFTRSDYMTRFREQATYGVHTTLAYIAQGLTDKAGIVVNPGLDWAYLLQPVDVAQLRG